MNNQQQFRLKIVKISHSKLMILIITMKEKRNSRQF